MAHVERSFLDFEVRAITTGGCCCCFVCLWLFILFRLVGQLDAALPSFLPSFLRFCLSFSCCVLRSLYPPAPARSTDNDGCALLVRACAGQGIYRVSGTKSRYVKLYTDVLQKHKQPSLVDEDITVVTSCLKHFLREMPDPLLTKHLYTDFINAVKGSPVLPVNWIASRGVGCRVPCWCKLC